MRLLALLPLAGLLLAADPSPEEQQSVIARIRAYGENYDRRLSDFVCVKSISRSVDSAASASRWKPLDSARQEIAYIGGREIVRTLHTQNPKKGYTHVGVIEFAGLALLFNAKAHVEMAWDRMEGPLCVARYTAGDESGARLTWSSGTRREKLTHSGFLFANCATGEVMRLVIVTDGRDGDARYPRLETDIAYAPVQIGAGEFLLPAEATDLAWYGKSVTRIQTHFSEYRKYQAQSSIQFDTQE